MEELKDQLKTAKNELESKSFAKATILYKDVFDQQPGLLNEWDLWSWARSLYKLKRYQETIEICRIGYKNHPKFIPMHSVYAWSIYHTNISIKIINDEDVFLKAVKGILKLSPLEDPYGPSINTLFKAAKYFVQKGSFSNALEWIEKIPFANLSSDVFRFKDNKGKWVEMASQKENYCAMKSKTLLKLEKYQACIDVCEFGLNEISKFHYNNNIWFRWRIVLANIQMKEWDKAQVILKGILKKKDDWFIKYAQAEIFIGQAKKEKAITILAEAALSYGDLDKKINLFKKMVFLFEEKGDTVHTISHLKLVYLILKSNDWNISPDIESLIQKYSIDVDLLKRNTILSDLKVEWEKLSLGDETFKKGKIRTILPNGKAGFIQSGKKSFYFKMSDVKGAKGCKEGQLVKYLTKTGFDSKKNKETIVAYKILIERM